MKITLLCCSVILVWVFSAQAQSTDDEVRRAKLAFAESQIVRPQAGELSPDAKRLWDQPNSGRLLEWCYRGRDLNACRGAVIGAASLILGNSKAVCLEDRILTVPKLIRIVITWHQDNPHLWDFTTANEQVELALAEQYPCPKGRSRR